MRNKLLLVLGLLMAFSSVSFAQSNPFEHDVTVNLTETRLLNIAGPASIINAKRSSGAVTAYTNASATITVQHDIILPQKLVAEVIANTGDWTDRNLSVLPAAAIGGGTPVSVSLIISGVPQPAGSVMTGIAEGTHPAVALTYTATAGLAAIPSTTPSVATIRYTLMD